MEFVTFLRDGIQLPGLLTADRQRVLSLEEAGLGAWSTLTAFIADAGPDLLARAASASAQSEGTPLSSVQLLAPIPKPCHDILCVGVNYRDHLEESEAAMGKIAHQDSVYFSKRAHIMTPHDATIDGHLDLDPCLDYEVELAVVICRECRNVAPEEAEDYIFGYSVFNDMSARGIQMRHNQWYRGKSLDGFAIMGPTLVHKSALPFPIEVDVCSRVNGELRQSSNTRLFLADIPHLISELSHGITLEPGDIIATGTPAGVGMGFDPPRWLKSGDTVECEIQGVGLLRTHIR